MLPAPAYWPCLKIAGALTSRAPDVCAIGCMYRSSIGNPVELSQTRDSHIGRGDQHRCADRCWRCAREPGNSGQISSGRGGGAVRPRRSRGVDGLKSASGCDLSRPEAFAEDSWLLAELETGQVGGAHAAPVERLVSAAQGSARWRQMSARCATGPGAPPAGSRLSSKRRSAGSGRRISRRGKAG